MKRLFILILFYSNIIQADQSFIRYGVGVFNSATSSYSEVKMANFGFQRPMFGILTEQYELGFWTDTRKDLLRKSSAFGFYSLGLTVEPSCLIVQSFVGIGGISHPDSMLGGPIQFTEEGSIGLKDQNGKSISVGYKHISSASLYDLNMGRDFMFIKLSVDY